MVAMFRVLIIWVSWATVSTLIDLSVLYHLIRAQSFMKIYVIFGMLEIFERLTRSIGMDIFDEIEHLVIIWLKELNEQALRNYAKDVLFRSMSLVNTYHQLGEEVEPSRAYSHRGLNESSSSPGRVGATESTINADETLFPRIEWEWLDWIPSLRVSDGDQDGYVVACLENQVGMLANVLWDNGNLKDGRSGVVESEHEATVFKNMTFQKSEKNCKPFGTRAFARYPVVVQIGIVLLVGIVYNTFHAFLHLMRILVTLSAMYSSDSIVFILLINANFAELKSTVFKKHSPQSIFAIISSDIVERFQIVIDAVMLQIRTSQAVKQPQSLISIFEWVIYMLSTEIVVDNIKHAFIFKFNRLKTANIPQYHRVLLSDLLKAVTPDMNMIPKDMLEKQEKENRFQIFNWACISDRMAGPEASARRLGFSTAPYATIIIFFLPSIPLLDNSSGWIIVAFAARISLWIVMLMLRILISLILTHLAICAHRKQPLGDAKLSSQFGQIKCL
eukprot:GHVH01001062.1.p1 GENE.GHVH01001062.1~~GHVH01001062.1.p1  ORF type:complete len:503 (+),score=59.71 GHVH01001062.1:911-2419(+)